MLASLLLSLHPALVLQYAIVKMVDGKPVYMNARRGESPTPEGAWLHASPENVRAVIAELRKGAAADYAVATIELRTVDLVPVPPPKHAGGWVVRFTQHYYAGEYRDRFIARSKYGVWNIEAALVYKTEAAARAKAAALQVEADAYASRCQTELDDTEAGRGYAMRRSMEDLKKQVAQARESAGRLQPTVIKVEPRD